MIRKLIECWWDSSFHIVVLRAEEYPIDFGILEESIFAQAEVISVAFLKHL